MIRSSLLLIGTGLITLIGCAGTDAAATGDDQNVTENHAVFQCTIDEGEDGSGLSDAFKLSVNAKSATAAFDDTGKFDAKFKPRTNVGFVRYLVAALNGDGSSDLLVEKKLLETGHGAAKVEMNFGEGGFSVAKYTCSGAAPASTPPKTGTGRGGSSQTAPVSGSHKFQCKSVAAESAERDVTVTVTLSATSATVVGDEDPSGDIPAIGKGTGPFDPTFRPRKNKAFVRYLVPNLLADGSSNVLVEKPMLEGAHGRLKVLGSGEGFSTSNFDCDPLTR